MRRSLWILLSHEISGMLRCILWLEPWLATLASYRESLVGEFRILITFLQHTFRRIPACDHLRKLCEREQTQLCVYGQAIIIITTGFITSFWFHPQTSTLRNFTSNSSGSQMLQLLRSLKILKTQFNTSGLKTSGCKHINLYQITCQHLARIHYAFYLKFWLTVFFNVPLKGGVHKRINVTAQNFGTTCTVCNAQRPHFLVSCFKFIVNWSNSNLFSKATDIAR